MDVGKQIIFEERRKVKASEVKIVFVDADNNFNVVDEEGNIKYVGIVKDVNPHKDDYCTCQSFYHGNSESYLSANGTAFQCKHIIKAKNQRWDNHPEIKIGPIRKDFEQKMVDKSLLL